MIIKLNDMRAGYVQLINVLLTDGSIIESRAGTTHELTGVTLQVDDPDGACLLPIGVGRGINLKLAAVEALQLIAGNDDVELLKRASPQYSDVLINPDDLTYGSYGLRSRYQIEHVWRELYHHPESRRAILSIWREQDLTHDGDRPCTLAIQFLLRDERLEAHVSMRSNDAWLGTPYDVFMFSQLQHSLARALGVGVGKYVHHVGSLHLYERNFDAAKNLAVSKPTDATGALRDYPRGVVSTKTDDLFTEVASYLIEGSATRDERTRNPWYVRQLQAVGVEYRDDA